MQLTTLEAETPNSKAPALTRGSWRKISQGTMGQREITPQRSQSVGRDRGVALLSQLCKEPGDPTLIPFVGLARDGLSIPLTSYHTEDRASSARNVAEHKP